MKQQGHAIRQRQKKQRPSRCCRDDKGIEATTFNNTDRVCIMEFLGFVRHYEVGMEAHATCQAEAGTAKTQGMQLLHAAGCSCKCSVQRLP